MRFEHHAAHLHRRGEAVQAALRVIDSHVHLWPADRRASPPRILAGQPFEGSPDACVETLLAELDRLGIERAVVVQTPWWAHDDRYLLDSAARFPGRLSVVGCLPLRLEDCDFDAVVARAGHKGLAGMRVQILGRNAAAMVAAGCLDRLLARCSDLGKTVLYWCRHPAAYALYSDIARKFPQLNAVVDHMGYASPVFGATSDSLEGMLALARHPSIHVKLSIQYQHSAAAYPWHDVFDLQRRLIAEFGASRCCWGSNWPMQTPAPEYSARLSSMLDAYPFRSAEERTQVMGGTAAALWPAPSAC